MQKDIEIGGRSYDGVGNVALLLADNGFREYYKPSDALFDACAAGRVLILIPWLYDAGKRHISRSDCVTLNNMAEEFCKAMESAKE